eukprot:CAMPEP_0170438802 /NCGR_PEP_ID=MMETSP0117_2-20130122/45439_1 /TAXON_ID=400756 /ORGANISM="Durinskia baltica, Strain CSIRO CS-38" /LENGTH=163 /DNA_ID=CAMNT_0010699069 /DNA_START=32 /DNA_END=523 /DNA_ORIENTATION=-
MTSLVGQPFQLGDVSPANLQQLKVVNLNTLPVKYSEKFYRELIDNYTTEYMKYCIWNGFVVGAVCARVEGRDTDDSKLYIMTINVLAAYRRRGIASQLLKYILDKAKLDPTIKEVYLHVQVGNDEAKQFYMSHGFEDHGIIKDYYKRIEPADCFILKMQLSQN